MEEVLANKFGWKTFTCVADERVDATHNPAEQDHDVSRKIRHAEKEGIKIREFEEGEPVPDELRSQCDARIKDWQANRNGKQMHISGITPWRDMKHRRYFFSLDGDGKIQALVRSRIAKEFDFRQKLGGQEDPIYSCFPPHGLGPSGGRAVVQFVESDH